jgi:hypothetical protein
MSLKLCLESNEIVLRVLCQSVKPRTSLVILNTSSMSKRAAHKASQQPNNQGVEKKLLILYSLALSLEWRYILLPVRASWCEGDMNVYSVFLQRVRARVDMLSIDIYK